MILIDTSQFKIMLFYLSFSYDTVFLNIQSILTDFENATPRLNVHIFLIKNRIVMNFSALYSSIIVAYPLKISMSSDKFNVLKTSSIEDRGHLISETIGISRIFFCFHPLQTDKMIVFENLI